MNVELERAIGQKTINVGTEYFTGRRLILWKYFA